MRKKIFRFLYNFLHQKTSFKVSIRLYITAIEVLTPHVLVYFIGLAGIISEILCYNFAFVAEFYPSK